MGDSALNIGFLYNHDQIHQLPHSVPIMRALAQRGGHRVTALTPSDRLAAEIRRLCGDLCGREIHLERLRLGLVSRLGSALANRFMPARKLLIYRDNLDLLGGFDALVMSEKTSLMLKTRYGLRVPLIHTRHGAGDRAIGYNRESALFDHILCAGPHIRDRLIEEAGVDPARIDVIGYPKFDLFTRPSVVVPRRGRGTIVYNPHPAPALSSWYDHGNATIAAARDAGWQTIFAPHIMLFERPLVMSAEFGTARRPPRLDPQLASDPLVHADLHGPALADMSYTLQADAYVGDASSQIYEFLKDPRPCVFVNSGGHEWQGRADFAHWQAGPVITAPDQLPAALDRAFAEHDSRWKPVQQRLFAERFDLTARPSGERGADAILDFLGTRTRS